MKISKGENKYWIIHEGIISIRFKKKYFSLLNAIYKSSGNESIYNENFYKSMHIKLIDCMHFKTRLLSHLNIYKVNFDTFSN